MQNPENNQENQSHSENAFSMMTLSCSNCGAQLMLRDQGTVYCPYCNSIAVMMNSPFVGRKDIRIHTTYHPNISVENARQRLLEKMAAHEFALSNFKDIDLKITTLYFPFWHERAQLRCDWNGQNTRSIPVTKYRTVYRNGKSYEEPYTDYELEFYPVNGTKTIEDIFGLPASNGLNLDQINYILYGVGGANESQGFSPHDSSWGSSPVTKSIQEAINEGDVQSYLDGRAYHGCIGEAQFLFGASASMISYEHKCKYLPVCLINYKANEQNYQNLVNLFTGSVMGDVPIDNSAFMDKVMNTRQKELNNKASANLLITTGILGIIATVVGFFIQLSKYHDTYLFGVNPIISFGCAFIFFMLLLGIWTIVARRTIWTNFLMANKEPIARLILIPSSKTVKILPKIYGDIFFRSMKKYVEQLANENKLNEVQIPVANAIAHAEMPVEMEAKFWQNLRQYIQIKDRF